MIKVLYKEAYWFSFFISMTLLLSMKDETNETLQSIKKLFLNNILPCVVTRIERKNLKINPTNRKQLLHHGSAHLAQQITLLLIDSSIDAGVSNHNLH